MPTDVLKSSVCVCVQGGVLEQMWGVNEVVEAQREQVTCPRSHSKFGRAPDSWTQRGSSEP